MEIEKEKNGWKKVKYHQKWVNAFRGVYVFWKTTNRGLFQAHLPVDIFIIILGFYFNISNTEWMILVLCIGFMLVAEFFNTAIEIDIDLTSPEYHPYARDTKDVAAAAVAISGVFTLIITLIIFLPKLLLIF